MQLQVQQLWLEQGTHTGERVVVEGLVAGGARARVRFLDGATANLLLRFHANAGAETLARMLAQQALVWDCAAAADALPAASGALELRDATRIQWLRERLQALLFTAERGEPILVGFPPFQGESW